MDSEAASAAHPPPPPAVRVWLLPCEPAGARLVLAVVEEEAQLRLDVQQDGTIAAAVSLYCRKRIIGGAQEARVCLLLAERPDGTVAVALSVAAEEDWTSLDSSPAPSCIAPDTAATLDTPPSEAAGPSPLQLRHAELLHENARLQGLVRQVRFP